MFRIGRNTFYDQKNKIQMKIPESKRSEIRKIAEFRGIPNRFPNLAEEIPQKQTAEESCTATTVEQWTIGHMSALLIYRTNSSNNSI